MRLAHGDNHQISIREGFAVCEVWSRPDLSAADGARSARQMVEFLTTSVLHSTSHYGGLVFDVRKGPAVFGPKTRETLASLFALAGKSGVAVSVIVGESPIQLLQFRNLCRDCSGRAEVFQDEASAFGWLNASGNGHR